jgi:1,4-alpha-glucan branching enzyme
MDKNLFTKQKRKRSLTVKKNELPPKQGIKKRYIKQGQSCRVTFCLPKEAVSGVKKVSVIGDFNDWEKDANPLRRRKTGEFSTTLELLSGRSYRFKYLLDDCRWENDWHADTYLRNPYGGEDSAVTV